MDMQPCLTALKALIAPERAADRHAAGAGNRRGGRAARTLRPVHQVHHKIGRADLTCHFKGISLRGWKRLVDSRRRSARAANRASASGHTDTVPLGAQAWTV